jgi:hypothetical protein
MQAWRALSPEQRMAAGAAAALAATLLLPWYTKNYIVGEAFVSDSVSAFGVFTFVEAAVLLVAGAVLYLLWARAQRRGFHLPGGDGTVILVAGAWVMLLLTWRVFDRPDIDEPAGTVGIQWGFFFAYTAAGVMALAGARLRAAHVPEPPNPADTPPAEPRRARRRRPATGDPVTEVLADPPEWRGEPPEPPERLKPATRKPAARPAPPPDPGTAETAEAPLGDEPRPPDRLF